MHHPRHDVSRTMFQLERFLFFSDGIFAICITLLIIEIKVPDHSLNIHTDAGLWAYLSENSLDFLSFLISFGVIGHHTTWSSCHHMIFHWLVLGGGCIYSRYTGRESK